MTSYLDQPIKTCEEFGKMMANEFEISMIGELSYFLGLQIKQLKNGIFVSQGKYIKDILKKFGMNKAKANTSKTCLYGTAIASMLDLI